MSALQSLESYYGDPNGHAGYVKGATGQPRRGKAPISAGAAHLLPAKPAHGEALRAAIFISRRADRPQQWENFYREKVSVGRNISEGYVGSLII